MRQRPEELVVDALNDVNEIFANIWGLGYEAGIKAADKATEKRVVREVIDTIDQISADYDNGTMFEHSAAASYISKHIKQKYGIRDDRQNQKAH